MSKIFCILHHIHAHVSSASSDDRPHIQVKVYVRSCKLFAIGLWHSIFTTQLQCGKKFVKKFLLLENITNFATE